VIGEQTGGSSVTLLQTEIPMHNHTISTLSANTQTQPKNTPTTTTFLGNSAPASLSPASISPAGSSLPHDNMQPYLAILFCICLYGIYPSRN